MEHSRALQIIDNQDWLDPLAGKLQEAVQTAFDSAGPAGQQIANALHGTWLGHPLHAAISDVPIGAWTTAAVLDAMEDVTGDGRFGDAASKAVGVGLGAAVLAAAAGLTDWHVTDGRARRIGLAHGLLNTAGVLLYAASLARRRNGSRSAGRGLSTLGFLASLGASYLGGKLVYTEQIGVDHTVGQSFPEEFTAVMQESELPDGGSRRADLNGSRILLARRGERIFAIAEVCSHLGGPLAEGKFSDCSVQCPWHGSEFSLEDGGVINGPATHPQPCLETRVHDGRIEVKRASLK
jgi:nitrite reductase/ring-hydroxylating ferredoxin subunit/uncharacterized membrane protein